MSTNMSTNIQLNPSPEQVAFIERLKQIAVYDDAQNYVLLLYLLSLEEESRLLQQLQAARLLRPRSAISISRRNRIVVTEQAPLWSLLAKYI